MVALRLEAARVTDCTGYRECLDAPVTRSEPSSSHVVLVVAFADPIHLVRSPRGLPGGMCTSLIVGPHDRSAVTAHTGLQHGVHVRLDPFDAYSLLGMPLQSISNEVLDLDAVIGSRLAERMAAAAGWRERSVVLDTVLARRIESGPQPDRAVEWAWHQLRATAGRARVAALADRIGWTPRHLARRFREQVGLPPKTVARIFRFEHATALLAGAASLADIAAESGYSDHAHLTREFRVLAGHTPSELRSHSFKPATVSSA